MSRSFIRRLRLLPWLMALGGVWPAGPARAEGLSFLYQPQYTSSSSSNTDQVGNVTQSNSNFFLQRFQLNADKTILPLLRFSGNGSYDLALGATTTGGAPPAETAAHRWNAALQLTVGDQLLFGTASYYLNGRTADFMNLGIRTGTPTFLNDSLLFTTTWRPDNLPLVTLLLQRSTQFDTQRTVVDQTTDDASVQVSYEPTSTVSLRYRFQYDHPVDHLSGTTSTSFLQQGLASYGQRFFDDLLSLYASYNFNARSTEISAAGPGGTISIQQFPIAGLSNIEVFPATPTRIALNPNPALIDGDFLASTGLNIGFGPSVSGDVANRNMGAQFTSIPPTVNTVWVWVDRQLPAAVSAAITWTAYRSDDNLNWTLVPIVGPVQFGLFQNRFEIPIEATPGRYIKVVTRPLPGGVTTDRAFADIFVTEIQLFQVTAAGSAHFSAFTGFLNTSARYQIIRSRLIYDFSASLSHTDATTAYNVTNGLTLNQGLGRMLTFYARLQRSDGRDPQGTSVQSLWIASLDAQFLPTLGASLTYNGELDQGTYSNNVQLGQGGALKNSLGAFLRAIPYSGISLVANTTFQRDQAPSGRRLQAVTTSAAVSITPHPALSLTGSWLYSATNLSGGGLPDTSVPTQRVEGSISVQPFPSLYASATVSRLLLGATPQTLASVSASIAPFPNGNLIFNFSYNSAFDSLTQSRSQIFGPFVRWTITPRLWLEATYTWLDFLSTVQNTYTRTFNARLTLWL